MIGRFLSPDPYSSANLALLAEEIVSDDDEIFLVYIQEPKNLNRYAYVQNNPVSYIDPSGLRIELVGSEEQKQYTLSQLSKFTRGDLSIDDAGILTRSSSDEDEGIESDIDELINSQNLYRIHPYLPRGKDGSGFGRSHTVRRPEGGADIYFDPNVNSSYRVGILKTDPITPAAELAHEVLGRGIQIERGIPRGRLGSSTRRRSNLRAAESANRAFIRMGMRPRLGYR